MVVLVTYVGTPTGTQDEGSCGTTVWGTDRTHEDPSRRETQSPVSPRPEVEWVRRLFG